MLPPTAVGLQNKDFVPVRPEDPAFNLVATGQDQSVEEASARINESKRCAPLAIQASHARAPQAHKRSSI